MERHEETPQKQAWIDFADGYLDDFGGSAAYMVVIDLDEDENVTGPRSVAWVGDATKAAAKAAGEHLVNEATCDEGSIFDTETTA